MEGSGSSTGFDTGHTEEIDGLEDYVEDASDVYEELYEGELATDDSKQVINEAFGTEGVLIGRLAERQESFIRIFPSNTSEKVDHFEHGKGLEYNVIVFRDGFYNPKHCTKVSALLPIIHPLMLFLAGRETQASTPDAADIRLRIPSKRIV